MSMRIHVVGAYGALESEFRAALDSIGDDGNGSQRFRVGSSGKWVWANASVWHVGGAEIDEALSSLSVPALRVTSSDAVLWMLTLTRAGRHRFHGVHHFTLVGADPPQHEPHQESHDEDFPDDELEEVAGINRFIPELEFLWDAEEEARLKKEYAEEEAETVEALDDYTDYGVKLPQAAIEEMKQHPHRAYYAAFMAHGPQIVEALHDFGFEFDGAAMLELLTVGPLTDLESDSDIGNMPRFLRALGIDEVFEEPEANEERSVDEGSEEDDHGAVLDSSKYPPGDDDGDTVDDDDDERLDEESSKELARFNSMLQSMSEAVERFNEGKVVPHGEEVVYEGRTGKFLRASMSDLEQVDQGRLEEHDATMDSFGFRRIGDFVGDADQRQEITRCYVGQQALALHGHRNEDNQFGWADVSKVVDVAKYTGEGQMLPTAKLPSMASIGSKGFLAVRIHLDDEELAKKLPLGAAGTTAIYTDFGKPFHVITKITIRSKGWMNYLPV